MLGTHPHTYFPKCNVHFSQVFLPQSNLHNVLPLEFALIVSLTLSTPTPTTTHSIPLVYVQIWAADPSSQWGCILFSVAWDSGQKPNTS